MKSHGVIPDRRIGGQPYSWTVDPVTSDLTIDLPPLRRVGAIVFFSIALALVTGMYVAFEVLPTTPPPLSVRLIFVPLFWLFITCTALSLVWVVFYAERIVLSKDIMTRRRRILVEFGEREYPLSQISNLRRGKPRPVFEVNWSLGESTPHREAPHGIAFEYGPRSVLLAKHVEDPGELILLIHRHSPEIVDPSEVARIEKERERD